MALVSQLISNVFHKDEDFSGDAINFGFVIFELLEEVKVLANGSRFPTLLVIKFGALSPSLADMEFQSIRHDGNLWGIALRQKREYLPYSIELLDRKRILSR